MRPMSPPFVSWMMVVAVALIVAVTLVVYLLRRVPPEISLRVVDPVGVLVGSSVWGPALGVVTAVVSAAAIGRINVPLSVDFIASDRQGAAAPTIVLALVVVIWSVVAPARSRSIGGDERRVRERVVAAVSVFACGARARGDGELR
jgi:hypothetical protein